MQGFHHFEIQTAILCVHGFGAEDGTVGGFLDTLQIPVSYGGVENAAILQDKYLTKELLFKEGIPVVEGRKITKKEYFSDDFSLSSFLADFSFPLILKPVHLGSSIGVHKCENLEDVERFIIPLFHLEEEVMIEKVISHLKEFNIAILGDERKIWVSEIEEVNAQDEVLSFENKYEEFSGMTYRKIPANISSSLKEEIEKYAKKGAIYFDLNAITGYFADDSKYKGLNEMKLGYGAEVTEYIGEFDLIIKENKYSLLWSTKRLHKEFEKKGV